MEHSLDALAKPWSKRWMLPVCCGLFNAFKSVPRPNAATEAESMIGTTNFDADTAMPCSGGAIRSSTSPSRPPEPTAICDWSIAMTLAAHVHRRRMEEGPAVAAAAMAVGRVANGDGGTRWFLDMTRNCDVVLEDAVVVLKEPGGQEGVHFRIDRRATGLSLLYVA